MFQGRVSALTVRVSQVEILPNVYTVNITHVEVLHIGESISNLSLSVGDTQGTSPDIIITDSSASLCLEFSFKRNRIILLSLFSQSMIVEFGQNILNTFDNTVDSGDVITILVEAYVATNETEPTNQVRLSSS